MMLTLRSSTWMLSLAGFQDALREPQFCTKQLCASLQCMFYVTLQLQTTTSL